MRHRFAAGFNNPISLAFPHCGNNLLVADADGIWEIVPIEKRPFPDSFLHQGWNLVSIPLEPQNADAGAVFDHCPDLEGNLYRCPTYGHGPCLDCEPSLCQPVPPCDEVYPEHFTTVQMGVGYWLYLPNGVPSKELEGTQACLPRRIPLFEGWNRFGHPWVRPLFWRSCLIYNPHAVGPQTVPVATAGQLGWINATIYYPGPDWEPGYQFACVEPVEPDPPDRSSCGDSIRPWHGYCIWANVSDLELIIPLMPPISISEVEGCWTSDTSAEICWITDIPSTSQVEYGKTRDYGHLTDEDSTLRTRRLSE